MLRHDLSYVLREIIRCYSNYLVVDVHRGLNAFSLSLATKHIGLALTVHQYGNQSNVIINLAPF